VDISEIKVLAELIFATFYRSFIPSWLLQADRKRYHEIVIDGPGAEEHGRFVKTLSTFLALVVTFALGVKAVERAGGRIGRWEKEAVFMEGGDQGLLIAQLPHLVYRSHSL